MSEEQKTPENGEAKEKGRSRRRQKGRKTFGIL